MRPWKPAARRFPDRRQFTRACGQYRAGSSGRHPTKQNLHDVVDIAIDCKVPIGDAVVSVPGMGENIAAISTFANAFTLNSLVIRTVAKLVERGIEPPVWRSGNAPGGDEANRRFIDGFQGRVKAL